ncbi:MAG: DUF2079 domain-containing protein [Candidatus Eremiobacteraeota bacterium]|nr:DUF2079 domain-containing protein [Candidatus Eremiobacteraeota bacterium]
MVAAAIFFAAYLALALNKLWALRYGADTGTFLQWLVNEAHGRGSWNGAEYRPHLQVHDSWTLLALVPLVALFPYVQTLLVVQVLAVASSGIALCVFVRVCGGDARSASFAGIAFLLTPAAQGLAYGNFLENVFVPLLATLGATFVRLRRFWPALIVAQALLGLKEDEALFLMWFGAACALWWDRRIGWSVAGLALLNGAGFAIAEHLHGAVPSIPAYGVHVDMPFVKLASFAALLASFGFVPLWLGRRLLLAAPLVAEVAFNKPWAYDISRVGTHWMAPLLAATAIGAAFAVARNRRLAVPLLAGALVCALFFNDTVLKIGRWPYVVDRAAFAHARALGGTPSDVVIPRSDEGAYAVAAASLHVLLARSRPNDMATCSPYNRDARAFFASLGIGTWPANTALCLGVPVPAK